MNKKELLDRCARSGEERMLLARALDKLELAQDRGVPAHTSLPWGAGVGGRSAQRLGEAPASVFGRIPGQRAVCLPLPA